MSTQTVILIKNNLHFKHFFFDLPEGYFQYQLTNYDTESHWSVYSTFMRDIFNTSWLIMILKVIGQCDIKHIMTLPKKKPIRSDLMTLTNINILACPRPSLLILFYIHQNLVQYFEITFYKQIKTFLAI